MEKMRKTPKTITLSDIAPNPYENRFVRSLIDACAFNIYGHWVKRGEEQNRAALFETMPKKMTQLTDSVRGMQIANEQIRRPKQLALYWCVQWWFDYKVGMPGKAGWCLCVCLSFNCDCDSCRLLSFLLLLVLSLALFALCLLSLHCINALAASYYYYVMLYLMLSMFWCVSNTVIWIHYEQIST